MASFILSDLLSFEWDEANTRKAKQHGLSTQEVESAFFDKNQRIIDDIKHSTTEKRYILVGKADKGTLLFVVFTVRGSEHQKIRVISPRKISKRKEVLLYEETARVA